MTPARANPRTLWHCLVFSSLLLAAACGEHGIDGPVDGARAYEHVRQLSVVIGERPFGSDGLARAADYLCAELVKLGLQPKRHEPIDEPSKKTIRNVYAQIDGQDPANGPILMLGAHYDSKLTDGHGDPAHNFRFVGAIDGGGAPAVLLELARVIQARSPKLVPNVWLYWIDAEESIDFQWNNERALLGSKAFCRWLSTEKVISRVKAFVLLDLIGDKKLKIDRDGRSNEQLQQIFERTAARLGVTDRVYKYSSSATDDHEVFRDYGVPSVLLIDFDHRIGPDRWKEMSNQPHPDPQGYAQWWHTPEDTIDQVSPDSLAFAGNLVFEALPELEAFVLRGKK